MRIMAVDYGDTRTGVAVSDVTGAIVGETWVITEKSQRKVAEAVSAEAEKRGAARIVIGLPKNMNGTLGPRAEKSQAFAELVKQLCGCDVILWDERMTTVSAQRILSDVGKFGKKRKNTIDAVAASLILEGYLGSLK